MCDGKCNCKSESNIKKVLDIVENMTDDEIIEAFPINVEWVQQSWGEQLMFAVPEESRNEPMIDVIKEIETDIDKYFLRIENRLNIGGTSCDVEKYLLSQKIYKDILNILKKYR